MQVHSCINIFPIPMSTIDFTRLHQYPDSVRRSWRISIFTETLSILQSQFYHYQNQVVPVPLPTHPISHTVNSEHDIPAITQSRNIKTEVEVYQGDCLEAGIRLKEQGLNPVVLNMANPVTPGGGVKNGAAAQEENVFRRSAYAHFLYDSRYAKYPISSTGAIYTPNVWVFRGLETDGYPLMEKPVQLAFIALPALVRPHLVEKPDLGLWLEDKDCELSIAKMRTCFKLALAHHHDSIVLSAWGCGAFRNPPRCIATLIHQVLTSPPYLNQFRKVVFAIYDDHNTRQSHNPEGNVKPFGEVFGVKPTAKM